MFKRVVALSRDGVPYKILEVKEFQNPELWLDFQKRCVENEKAFREQDEREKEQLIAALSNLQQRLKAVERELAYNRGDITKEEYENGVA